MKKILIGFDTHPSSVRAIEHVGKLFAGVGDLEVTLVHVLPNVPASFWDDGHILSDQEAEVRNVLVDTWAGRQRKGLEPEVEAAAKILQAAGMPRDRIKTKFISGSNDVADSILDEAAQGHYSTVVLGRRGAADGHTLLLGSVASKVIHKAKNIAICIVE